MLVIEFQGHIPSKKNSKQVVSRGGRTIVLPSKAYQRWHDREIQSLLGVGLVEPPVKTVIEFWIGGVNVPGEFDLSNAEESINDLLRDAGVLADDSWLYLADTERRVAGFIRGESRTIVTVSHIDLPWYDRVLELKDSDRLNQLRIEQGCTKKAIVDGLWATIANGVES